MLGVVIPFLLIPAAVLAGAFVFREKGWAFLSLGVAVLSLLLFITGFEKKKTGTRRLLLAAVLTGLAVTGRFIFSPIPGVNPITAITVLAAVYMGGESGFLIGALSALISDVFAGQGVWTPFQMLAWGLLGLIAGLFSKYLAGHRIRLCVYNFFGGILYSLIMDLWTVIWYNGAFNGAEYLAAITTALPFTAVYSVSNILFTLLLEKPFGEKLTRMKKKYGI